jgi:hypothetical protein
MANKFNPQNIQRTLAQKELPTVISWNRLEGRPRTHDFSRALKAEVRDALWMLTKQWQMGELNAEDAGSPVFSKIHIATTQLNTYTAADHDTQNFEGNVPLEVKVEQKKIPFIRENKIISIDIRLQMGQYWLRMLKKSGLDYNSQYINLYGFVLSPQSRELDYIYANREVWQQYAAISGRSLDGYRLYQHISDGKMASEGILIEPENIADQDLLDQNGAAFKTWFESMYYQPLEDQNDAWLPDRLEYQLACSAVSGSQQKNLQASEYYSGHLDWYSFDIEQKQILDNELPKKTDTQTFIPSHVQFAGMPDTRWWKFEDGKTSLGDIKPSTTDLGKLLLMEFGLIFSNDWFMIPYKLPVGSLANIEGLTVTNNFGETTWINATEVENEVGLPWSMFKLNSSKQNNTVFLAPSAMKVHEGNSLEEILLIKDEISNMVWGIETIVPMPTGKGEKGNELALRIRQFHEKIVQSDALPLEIPYAADISYLAMTTVPENWIPFIPVHVLGDNRETQLQRASMPRIIQGDPQPAVKIKPQTSILREGLENVDDDGGVVPLAYYIHEEEVPRSGIKIQQSFQRTRWTNGEIFVWLGMKKKTGKGEGNSNLSFDQIVNAK